jgi:hypothetical protein
MFEITSDLKFSDEAPEKASAAAESFSVVCFRDLLEKNGQ